MKETKDSYYQMKSIMDPILKQFADGNWGDSIFSKEDEGVVEELKNELNIIADDTDIEDLREFKGIILVKDKKIYVKDLDSKVCLGEIGDNHISINLEKYIVKRSLKDG